VEEDEDIKAYEFEFSHDDEMQEFTLKITSQEAMTPGEYVQAVANFLGRIESIMDFNVDGTEDPNKGEYH